ncbi:hypothetical protein JCM5350_000335 [Sporobolomyces pararoseus]
MGAFDGSIGAFLLGTVFACFLSGLTSSQSFQYYQNFPIDRKLYKYLVGGLWILDLTHTAVSIYTIWDWCVANYGNVEHLLVSPWSFGIDPAMVGLVSFICQSFYAYRVYVVGKRKIWIPLAIVLLSLVSFGFAIGASVTVFTLKEFSKFQSYTYGIAIWLALLVTLEARFVSHITNKADPSRLGETEPLSPTSSATLVFHLKNSKTGMANTNSILDKLIELVISTNGATSIVALVDAIVFGLRPEAYHVIFNLCLPKLYVNSLLVSLNARVDLERRLIQSTSRHETLGLHDLSPVEETSTRNGNGVKSQGEVRTALGFGAEDCNLDVVHSSRRTGTKSLKEGTNGIQVTTQ